MSEPTYSLSITESERTALARTLGILVSKLINAPVQIDGAKVSPPGEPSPAVAPIPQTPVPETRDRWARDRKGKEVSNPEGCESQKAQIFQTEMHKKGTLEFLHVAWYVNSSQGSVDGNCFDASLWPHLIKAKSQPSVLLHFVRKGNYLNIVGIRA